MNRIAYPLLAARIRMAALFGLTVAEALLVEPVAADQGLFLLIDIRDQYPRARRRVIMIEKEERSAFDQILRYFENIDCGPTGTEGCYRKRLYLLKKLFSRRSRHCSR